MQGTNQISNEGEKRVFNLKQRFVYLALNNRYVIGEPIDDEPSNKVFNIKDLQNPKNSMVIKIEEQQRLMAQEIKILNKI